MHGLSMLELMLAPLVRPEPPWFASERSTFPLFPAAAPVAQPVRVAPSAVPLVVTCIPSQKSPQEMSNGLCGKPDCKIASVAAASPAADPFAILDGAPAPRAVTP